MSVQINQGTLQVGDTGSDVLYVQEVLNSRGYISAGILLS